MADLRPPRFEAPAAPAAAAVEGAVLKIRPDGPNVLTGNVMLAGTRVATSDRTTLVLCRCGASCNKPYCDGTHMRVGFRDPGILPADAAAGTRAAGHVTVTPAPNGPLECVGPLAIEGSDGRMSCVNATRLCRCGHSLRKPFCDSSHARIGFVG